MKRTTIILGDKRLREILCDWISDNYEVWATPDQLQFQLGLSQDLSAREVQVVFQEEID